MNELAPLLKWAGGKRQLLPQLRRFYPSRFNRYIEPFFGSGAVFFDLQRGGRLADREVVLVDSNPDLVGCYEAVRDRPERVADELERLAEEHAGDPRATYLHVRDERFNPSRLAAREPDGRIRYTPALAAMLIYLNRTGFNGLFRVNNRGAFNVPPGRYTRPRIADRSRVLKVSAALARPCVQLLWGSYETVAALAGPGDFLYVDPPYAPLTKTAHFTAYTAAGFGADDQRRLQELMVRLATTGSLVLMSNSTAGQIRDLYEKDPAARSAGLRVMRVPARRAINSNCARRGPVDEYLITNVRAEAKSRTAKGGSRTLKGFPTGS